MHRRPSRVLLAAAAVVSASLVAGALAALPAGAAAVVEAASPSPTVAPADSSSLTARSLGVTAARPLARPTSVAATASPATVALAVAREQAGVLGVRGALAALSVRPALGGGHIVRLQQTIDGVPVLGGEVVVDLDAAGRTRSANAESLPGVAPDTTPRISAARASETALAVVVKHHGLAATALRATSPTLSIFDPRIFGADGRQVSSLVWRVDVTSATDRSVRRMLLIDAVRGYVTLDLDTLNAGKTRSVCDALSTSAQVPCASPVRTDLTGPVGAPGDDVNLAYDFAGVTYDFYLNVLGRDSIDGIGLPLVSTVRFCPAPTACPYANAFWDGSQMVYGAGYATADDVVAHELTHGVTQNASNLYYYFQSGAINESLSDIFGEFVDQTNVQAADTVGVKWLMGEDLSIGAIRSMANPPAFGDPDWTGSPSYGGHTFADSSFDSGGVHSNSGVGNKFAYLLTDGDTFRGITVTGLGIPKAAAIIYEAALHLTSGADYKAFAGQLRNACVTVSGAGTNGVSPVDCTQVDAAILAVAMDATPVNADLPAAPSVCPAGTVSQTRFADTMEVPANGRWTATSAPGSPAPLWFYGSSLANPYGVPQVYATDGVDNLWGDDPDMRAFPQAVSDHSMEMTTGVAIPTGTTYLRFDHAFGFEAFSGAANPFNDGNFDGGVLEYSANNGQWLPAGSLMGAAGNGYGFNAPATGSTVVDNRFGNPLGGQAAFVGQSQGYVTSRATLSGFAGKSVRFRFRIGADDQFGDFGWFVDNVKIYSCVPILQLSTPPTTVLAATTLTYPLNDSNRGPKVQYRWRVAAPGGVLGAYTSPRFMTTTTQGKIGVPLVAAGGTTCVNVVANDPVTHLASSQLRCVTLPVDDRRLRISSTPAWLRVAASTAFNRTLLVSKLKGALLTLPSARGTRLVIVAQTLRGGGTIGVYVKGRRVALISLNSATTVPKKVFDIGVAGLAGVPVQIKVESTGATVAIDGIGVR